MTVQSLKTISESSLDFQRTQFLKLGGGYLKKKMADTIFFYSKVVPLDPEMNTENSIRDARTPQPREIFLTP